MWSDKKYINIIINVLLFLLGINFMHYGQFTLPLICLILFIDSGFKLHVRSLKTFVILCLFAITTFIFTYKDGFYSVMGFCLPMAYYVGNNLKENNENGIKKVIYIIGFGMAFHLVLNFFLELYWWHDNLSYMFNKPSHYDIWLMDRVKSTGSSMDYLIIVSSICYIFRFEKNKYIKIVALILFVLSSIYCVALARRTTFIIAGIVISFSILFDLCKIKRTISLKTSVISFIALGTIALVAIYIIRKTGFLVDQLMIFYKLFYQGLNSDRLTLFFDAIKLYPKYLFGGRNISVHIGQYIHDIWGDIYDYAGVIPYSLFIIYSILVLNCVFKLCNKTNKKDFVLLVCSIFISLSIEFFIEPVYSGASIMLICFVLIFSLIEGFVVDEHR